MMYTQVSCHRDKGSEQARSGSKEDNDGQVLKPQDKANALPVTAEVSDHRKGQIRH
jgi:hypothetical protein